MSINSILLLGGGVIGINLFYQLSQNSSANICLIEQQTKPNNSSTSSAGIFRCFHDDFELTKMALKSHLFYQNLIKQYPIEYFNNGLLIFTPYNENVQQQIDWLNEQGYKCEYIQPNDGKERFSQFRWNCGAIYEHSAGYYNVLQIKYYLMHKALENPRAKVLNYQINKIIHNNKRVIGVSTNFGKIFAEKSILCAGAWTPSILQNSNIKQNKNAERIFNKKIQINYYSAMDENIDINYPCFIDRVNDLYGRPDINSKSLHLGTSTGMENVNPDLNRYLEVGQNSRTNRAITNAFSEPKNFELCGGLASFDAYTQSTNPVIVKHDSLENFYIASGFSGGGFKLAPQIAQHMIDIVKPNKL